MDSAKAHGKLTKESKFPHIYFLLFIIIALCVIATWLIPAGEFDRAKNEAGSMVVVPGTYHAVEPNQVGPFEGLIAIYRGMVDAGGIVFFVFISFAMISLIIQTGSFNGLIASMLKKFKGDTAKLLVIPTFIFIIGIGSSTMGLFEENLPFIPIFVGIATAMGFDAIVGMAIIAMGAAIGYAGAAINPFTVGIAQGIAELQPLSGAGFRVLCHLAMITVASLYTMRYASKIMKHPESSLVYGDDIGDLKMDESSLEKFPFGAREKTVLFILLGGIVAIVVGSKYYHWYYGELASVFIIIGVSASLVYGWGPNEIARRVAKGFGEIAMACMMIGIARTILVVLRDGRIIDSVVYGMSQPLTQMPRWLAAEAMLGVQTLLNFLIPSGSGQAATSMPIMAPLSDLLQIPRQVAVLTFQFGDGLSNILWPTAFMPVVCGLARVRIDKWLKWFVPLFFLLILTQMTMIAIAIAINYQ